MLKFYIRHGMEVVKVHNIISFKQSRCLEKYINFNTQKRNKAKNDFEKDFYKLLNNAFYGKTMENDRNRLKSKFIKKDDHKEIIKQQSKLIFNGNHKSYDNCDSYTFKQNEVLMDKLGSEAGRVGPPPAYSARRPLFLIFGPLLSLNYDAYIQTNRGLAN